MAVALPFITKPQTSNKYKVGNAEIGELEIPKLNDLSINERRYLKELTAGLPDLKKEAVKMAEHIAEKMQASVLDVYVALTSGDTAYLSEHLAAVLDFQEQMDRVTEQRLLALTTTIIKFRIVPEWTTENTGDANLIPPELVKEIAWFAQREEESWAKQEEPTDAEGEASEPPALTEDDLGKSETL